LGTSDLVTARRLIFNFHKIRGSQTAEKTQILMFALRMPPAVPIRFA
jgi:hypothetical protein